MAYFLRTTKADGTSYGGFRWPREVGAVVEAPDWNAKPKCGGGLHGLRGGLGNSSFLDWSPDALWWIVDADDAGCIDLGGQWKFPRCKVVAVGQRHEITVRLHDLRPGPIHGLVLTGGGSITLTGGDRSTLTGRDRSTLTGGDESTLTGGYGSTLTGGYGSTLTGGTRSTLTGGDESTLTGGTRSTLTGGDGSTLTGGDRSTLTGGDGSTLTGGDRSTMTGGDRSTMTGGYGSTLTGGDGSTLTGGDRSTMTFLRWIGGRRRALVAYVGEGGIKPGVAYRANDDHTAVVEAA